MIDRSNRTIAVYHGCLPPRNSFEMAMAFQGEEDRKAMRKAWSRPSSRREPVRREPRPKRDSDGGGQWSLAVVLVVVAVLAAPPKGGPSAPGPKGPEAQVQTENNARRAQAAGLRPAARATKVNPPPDRASREQR